MVDKKTHLPFDSRCNRYPAWEKSKDFPWLMKYPQTLCWRSVKGRTVSTFEDKTTCKMCLKIAKTSYSYE